MARVIRRLAGAVLALGLVAAQATPVTGQGTWETTLKARGINGNPVALNDASAVFFYDTVLNLTWLGNWNANGLRTWSAANAWAAALSPGGFGGWSLPGVLDIGNDGCNFSSDGGTDCGYNVYSGEVQRRNSPLAHMFYDTLGNLAYCPPGDADCNPAPQTGWGLTNTGPFSNMQSYYYWSGTAYAPHPAADAWLFNTGYGIQHGSVQHFQFYAVAVRPGDVFAGSAPEPGSVALLLAGLGALGLARRRRTP